MDRWTGKVALAQSLYGHHHVQHNRGHHAMVATPQDPSSSRLGEGFWRYLPRVVVGRVRDAWVLESRRLARHGRRAWSVRNEVLGCWALSALCYGLAVAAFGPRIWSYLLVQAAVGIVVTETVSYLEHYGLPRRARPDGRFEPPAHRHCWNSNTLVSNIVLFNMQLHSDHHVSPARHYQTLRHLDTAPQLPAGYAALIPVAWCPPLWRRLMDPRVLAHYGGDITLANRGFTAPLSRPDSAGCRTASSGAPRRRVHRSS